MNPKQVITNPYVPPTRPVLVAGRNGLPKLVMTAADGARAEVYLHGGQITSWVPAGGNEWLFVSSCADFHDQAAIRGGMPVAFPRIGSDGRLPRHGFARSMEWGIERVALTESGRVVASFRLTDSRASWSLWRHRFALALEVSVGGASLEARLTVANDGRKPFRFSAALQNYLRLTGGVADVRVLGLEGHAYRDQRLGPEQVEQVFALDASAGCHRLYPAVRGPLLLRDGTRTLQLSTAALPDIELWNPSIAAAAGLADLDVDEQPYFLRLTAAMAAQSVWLQPDERWQGSLLLTADEPPLAPAR
jgi:glucose-6-phosphate 1-epimerase